LSRNVKLEFAEKLIYLKREPIRFVGRPYLPALYASTTRNLVIRASRQVEKSTLLVNQILYWAAVHPGIQLLFVTPRLEQARVFVRTRLLPALEESPLLRAVLLGNSRQRSPLMNMSFENGSQLFVRAAFHSADAARGISADVLIIDECQDVAAGDLPTLQETMSHSAIRRLILAGTPKLIDNPFEALFNQSTAHEWTMPCTNCGLPVIPDERCLGAAGITCPQCQTLLNVADGHWVARNPDATWGDGYWINHLLAPWLSYDDVLERQREYDAVKFRNEVLGLAVSLGDHMVTRAQLEACCSDRPMATSIADIPHEFRGRIIAGIDWGGGSKARTVVVVGYMRPDARFEICHLARFRANEAPDRVLKVVAELSQKFHVRLFAADGGGNGSVYNPLLLKQTNFVAGLYAINYSRADQEPVNDGVLTRWTVHRSKTISYLFTCVQARKLVFPRVQDCGSFLDEIYCEVAEWDEYHRDLKYVHPLTQQDDTLHALNYALQVACRGFSVNTDAYEDD
jgi:hypothetical protein